MLIVYRLVAVSIIFTYFMIMHHAFIPSLCMDKSISLSLVGDVLVVLLLEYEHVDSINNVNTEDTPKLRVKYVKTEIYI